MSKFFEIDHQSNQSRSHFIHEDGHFFAIEYLPDFSLFQNLVYLTVTESQIFTWNTHSFTSDKCLCFLNDGNWIMNAAKVLFLKSPLNFITIPTTCFVILSCCLCCLVLRR